MTIVLLLVGLGLIVLGANWLVEGLSQSAVINISKAVDDFSERVLVLG